MRFILLLSIIPLGIIAQYNYCDKDLEIKLTTQPNLSYNWNVDGYITTEQDATLNINRIGTYQIVLEITNEFGCTSIDKVLVNVDECKEWTYYAPNAFVPDGENKTWIPVGENITIDLIYGSKFSNLSNWKKTLDKVIALDIKHISSYNLTIEDKTKLGHDFKVKKEVAIDDEKSSELFLEMIDRLEKNNFIHYEISNFGKDGFFSTHNSNYWKGKHYIGLGPSAHSFDGVSRQWNVSNNNQYMKQLSENSTNYFEKEILTEKERFNEYILVSLRTIWGIDLIYLQTNFNSDFTKMFLRQIDNYIKQQLVVVNGTTYCLTENGKLLADKIASDLFA